MATTHANRWLTGYGRTLTDPTARRALGQAKDFRDQAKQSAVMAGANPIHLNDIWGEFGDFHAVRRDAERLQGNKYSVGGFSGGGDVNTRPTGAGSTMFTATPTTTRASAARPTTVRQSGTGPSGPGYRWLDKLRAEAEAAGLQNQIDTAAGAGDDRALAAQLQRDQLNWQPGTPNARAFARAEGDFARGEAERNADTNLGIDWRRFTRLEAPKAGFKHQFDREIADLNAEPARIAAGSRQFVEQLRQSGRFTQAQLGLLETMINAAQRGETGNVGYNDERAGVLGGTFDDLLRQGNETLQTPLPGRASGAGPLGGGTPIPQAALPTGAMETPEAPPDFGPELYGNRVQSPSGAIWVHNGTAWVREE